MLTEKHYPTELRTSISWRRSIEKVSETRHNDSFIRNKTEEKERYTEKLEIIMRDNDDNVYAVYCIHLNSFLLF